MTKMFGLATESHFGCWIDFSKLVEIGGLDFFRLWKDQHVKKFLQEIADYITSKYMTKALKIWTYVIKTIDRASG